MKFEGRTKIVVCATIGVVGVSGIIEALPHAHERVGDLLFDAAILAGIIGASLLLTRLFGRRNPKPGQ